MMHQHLTPTARVLALLRDVGLGAFVLYACWHTLAASSEYAFEDAYITYRYADNLAAGNGFVFNPGERVLGTTTPLFTLLLAMLETLGLEVVTAGRVLYVAGLALVVLAGGWILRRAGYPNLAVLLAALVFFGVGRALHYLGMETSLYSFLLLATMLGVLHRRPVLTGVCLGLAVLTRYDAVVLAGPVLLFLWIRDRRLPLRTLLVSAALVLPWVLFAWWYFGSPLPNTLDAKARSTPFLEYLLRSAGLFFNSFDIPAYLIDPGGRLANASALLLVVLLGPLLARTASLGRREPALWLVVIFPVLLWLGYSVVGPPVTHRWYLVPGLYFLLLAGLLAWGQNLERLPGRRWFDLPALGLLAACFWLFPGGVQHQFGLEISNPSYARRVATYQVLAEWLRDHDLTELSILTSLTGYLSYVSKNPVIDGAGLVTRGIYRHRKELRVPIDEIVERHRPDLVLETLGSRLSLSEYVPLYHASSGLTLHVRRPVLRDKIADLARDFLAATPQSSPETEPGTISQDFDEGQAPGWSATWGVREFVGRPMVLQYEGSIVQTPYLHTGAATTGTITSPTFRVDFDELRFRFGANDRQRTAVQLLVDGFVVLSEWGTGDFTGVLHDVTWPVSPWRGRSAQLRFLDESALAGFLVADQVESVAHRERVVFDDFETGEFGERWYTTFAGPPQPSLELGAESGPGLVLGRFSAVSRGLEGLQRLQSRRFPIQHDGLSFLVFDFGGRSTKVELRAADQLQRVFVGTGSGQLRGVTWDVSDLRGQEAMLRVVDNDQGEGNWIGIDEILMFDRP